VRLRAAALPVEFHGWVPNVFRALAELELLLVPSARHEATARVIAEAFSAGVPVIAFRSGGIPEVVEHGRTGLLVRSAQEMAGLAVELLRDPARRAAMARQAKSSWESRFTLERYRHQMINELQKAAGW
jgi:glycosyltransferase involved in cell wall biosynthesis